MDAGTDTRVAVFCDLHMYHAEYTVGLRQYNHKVLLLCRTTTMESSHIPWDILVDSASIYIQVHIAHSSVLHTAHHRYRWTAVAVIHGRCSRPQPFGTKQYVRNDRPWNILQDE